MGAGYRRGVTPDIEPTTSASDAATEVALSDPGPSGPGSTLDVVAVGNALVDVLASSTDGQVAELGLTKGTMALVDRDRAAAVYDVMGDTMEASGGSAANTVAGVAALGGRCAYIGRVADDLLGQSFLHDIRALGVAFDPPVVADGKDAVTGHCLVLVTEDAQRTMVTHLGVAAELGPADLNDGHLVAARVLYLEGYLWEQPPAKAAMRAAMERAHETDGSVALSLSDPFCVQHHREEFLELLDGHVDLLFANEEEIVALFGARDFDAAAEAVADTGVLAALTRGAEGCVVVAPGGRVVVPAAPVEHVVDTTGAGDLFAAGFLYGITHGHGPEHSGRLGALCAAEVISHVGARPLADLRKLAVAAGLLDR